MKLPVSVVILTKNEKDRMQKCLESVRGFEQVIVIDSLSEDGTLQQCRELWKTWEENEHALTLVSRAWPGFTQARNESLEWVRNPWVLWLDADEWVSKELIDFCHSLNASLDVPKTVYEFPRQSFFLGTRIRHGGWYPDYKKRLAPTKWAVWKKGPQDSDVHEDLELHVEGVRFERLKGVHIFHESFRDEDEQKQTNELYSGLLAEGLCRKWQQNNQKPPSDLYICLKPWVKFVENYIYKLGFMDGRAGFKIALGSSWSMKQRFKKAKTLYLSQPPADQKQVN